MVCHRFPEHTNRDTVEQLAQQLGLSEDERKEMLPSGKQQVFDNRVAWARAHLKMANLIENPRRGVFQITQRGKKVVDRTPTKVDLHFLHRFPEYAELREERKRKRQATKVANGCYAADGAESKTPEEQLVAVMMRGVDGISKEDRLELGIIYIQEKRWGNTVPRPNSPAPCKGSAPEKVCSSQRRIFLKAL